MHLRSASATPVDDDEWALAVNEIYEATADGKKVDTGDQLEGRKMRALKTMKGRSIRI